MKCRKKGDSKCHQDNDVINSCIKKMISADAIIIGSPVYFADVTSEVKALIDVAGYAIRGGNKKLESKSRCCSNSSEKSWRSFMLLKQ